MKSLVKYALFAGAAAALIVCCAEAFAGSASHPSATAPAGAYRGAISIKPPHIDRRQPYGSRRAHWHARSAGPLLSD